MITLTEPKDGWITLSLDDGWDQIDIDFSDVGPDSIGQLKNAVQVLKAGHNKCEIEFFLEPCYLLLKISASECAVDLLLFVDGKHVETMLGDKSSFIEELEYELARILPLCVDPAWTHYG